LNTKIGIALDESFYKHDTGLWHPETPDRLYSVAAAIDDYGREYVKIDPTQVDRKHLLLIHEDKYIDFINSISNKERIHLDPDTIYSPGTKKAALKAVGCVIKAVDLIEEGIITKAFCAVRPPGHHAESDKAMGFCIFNNVAIGAAYYSSKYSIEKAAIIDWDVHHGNGTQNAFYESDKIFYISLHQYPHFPGTGSKNETGHGNGKGYTLNIPMKAGSADDDYRKAFNLEIIPALENFAPEVIFISAGFDAHTDDPLGGVYLSTGFFGEMTSKLSIFANENCQGRLISVLEGGYNGPALRESVAIHLEELSK